MYDGKLWPMEGCCEYFLEKESGLGVLELPSVQPKLVQRWFSC